MKIRVFLADDHAVVRDGLKSIIEKKAPDIIVAGEACDGQEALCLLKTAQAHIAVFDIAMPRLNGLEAASRLLKRDPKALIILLSMYDNKTFIEQAFSMGVRGYVLKESAPDEIIRAIRTVYTGQYYLSPRIAHYVVRGFAAKQGRQRTVQRPACTLTPREKEVLQLVAEGNSTKEIAAKLQRSANTIHVHRNRIMEKLNIHNQAELVRFALKEGISAL
ncbi:MAG: hypothetical protein A2268_12155 [Candidatus Raymondbacteria bacterium RifOxyA12_full_50_37]|uniref:DNA-binding response regulator n=1 Tax=Candidatus Raymondbacteria bacterium RIFOXYD12_FULL_49_13 TaxID=1817890 RepID=A0A1F7F2N4_UNCRA|nr:MAG: hypothetical protein A2268_12155 [Candidatus Raymondbacteria bacterium RifOxyA12_full_50_37]OGJ90298.1 MAG: hypothetical protein A2248_00040 [Candidatus Raymondbacteria bacterium RIFOXYA2_FULL_49_16]OGJ97288.1 MAG: hypothetical protein A2453_01500 [Candidatus Raymondbacteria bacterium RIFOXYC2_FULL_50_21]OGK00901.1 MAG: hypothetical protein A2519_12670 [Candidatus Raymondbacteria bacterium RIFOXYD12_FULL_49_13]OGK02512.1 MAG: hypothetical protein A2350_09945 [Candidatus Raymondbacteria 